MQTGRKKLRVLVCSQCGKKYIYDSVSKICPKCGGTLEEGYIEI